MGQSSQQLRALSPKLSGLLGKNVLVLQGKQRTFAVQDTDVVGRTHLVDLGNQGFGAHHVTKANTRQSKFTQRAHEQHMGMAADAVDVALAGKRLVGLIHDHQAALLTHGLNDFLDHLVIPHIGGGVVGVSQIGDGRAVFFNGGQHGGFIQLKISGERHAVKGQSLQLGTHGVHHKAGHRGQNVRHFKAVVHTGRHIAGQRQQADQLVRAIAQHDIEAFGHAGVFRQRVAQIVDAVVGVTVERQGAQALAEFCLQIKRQTVRVFHRVQLDHAF